jgi:glycosyltransferase
MNEEQPDKERPMISIITPTFNSAATVRDTLESVYRQTHRPLEHLIADGGSTDATLAIIAEYPHAHCISEPDKGLYDAMNKGIARARGEVVGILNSDDFYAHEVVLEHVMALFQNPEVDVVYGDLHYVHPIHTQRVVRRWRSGAYRHAGWRWGWMPPHPTFFVRRRHYERYGVFDTSFRSAADYELMLRFCYKHRLRPAYLPDVLVKMRTGGASNASLRQRLRANGEDRRAWAVNELPCPFYTTWMKPLRKLGQWRWDGKF